MTMLIIAERAPTWREFTLNRPRRRNALSSALVDALIHEIEKADEEPPGLIVIRGTGPVFCAGFDLTGLEDESDPTLLWRFARIGLLLESLRRSASTTVAVLSGPAVGAGADLALACDVRLATSEVSFRFPGASFGLSLGFPRLVGIVGPTAAAKLHRNGGELTADDAQRAGICDLVASADAREQMLWQLHHCRPWEDTPRAGFMTALDPPQAEHDTSLAELVRSIAGAPGLHERMVAFRNHSRPPGARRGSLSRTPDSETPTWKA